ncbi:MAG: hypothetical protein B5M56_05525 [Desulfococcus sp. 4484_241]|nr:MAG: hypothetical protein B5M56_05525 [Desulfococcus sp. 4484_241]
MAKVFNRGSREARLLSKIESSKEYERRTAIAKVRDISETLATAITSKLIEAGLVETKNQNSLEEMIHGCLEELTRADDFDVDYSIAPFRTITAVPNIVSLYVTAFVIEKVIDHRDTVDIYGSDEEIYVCINRQVTKYIQ